MAKLDYFLLLFILSSFSSNDFYLANLLQNRLQGATILIMKKETSEKLKWLKNFSALQIAMFVLTAVLIVASIVTMGIIIDLKNKKEAAKERNDQLSSQMPESEETEGESWQKDIDLFIENQNNQ